MIILAVPPPSDEGHNPKAPFAGRLVDRVEATRDLNHALDVAVRAQAQAAQAAQARARTRAESRLGGGDNGGGLGNTVCEDGGGGGSDAGGGGSGNDGDFMEGVTFHFTGAHTWDFATVGGGATVDADAGVDRTSGSTSGSSASISAHGDGDGASGGSGGSVVGSLRADMSDGHVHVQPSFTAPLHKAVKAIIQGARQGAGAGTLVKGSPGV